MNKNCYKKSLYFSIIILLSSQSNAQESSGNTNDAGRPSGGALITPRVSISEYYTDNYYRTSAEKKSGWTTDLSPGVHMSSSAGRITGSLDYSLHQVIQSNDSSQNELQNALDATGSWEAIDRWAYVDVNGKISQRTISAFGTQSSIDSSSNTNKTEVSSYRVSPYVKGRLNYFADYEARYEASTTRAKGVNFANSNTESVNFNLNGTAFKDRLHWTSQLSTSRVEQGLNQTTRADSFKNSLSYLIDPQLSVSASFGREYGNYISSEPNYKNTTGGGVVWSPSERTTVSANFDNTYAGKTHKFNLEHRTSKTSWRISDTKNVSFSNALASNSIQSNAYDLLFSQLAAVEPDPVKRAAMVNNLLMTNYGSSSSSILSGYLTSGASIQRTQDFSFSLLGLRDVLTFTAMKNVGRRIDQVSIGLDDFDNTSIVTQRAVTASLTHRLGQEATISSQFTIQRNSSDSSSLSSNLKSLSIDASSRVNLKTMITLGVRRTIYYNSISPYNVNSISGGLTVQF